jgi:HAD superfamily hydrolase (TIGR01509 family)
MKEWVIFDLDGTLIESEQLWRDVRRDLTVEFGGKWHADAQRAMMGMRTDDWARYMHDTLGVPLSPGVIKDRIIERLTARLSKNVPILSGADAALERLGGAFELGLATSSAYPVARAVLDATGWEKHFATVVSADSVERGKPAPDVYDRALALLGAEAARTAAVEDSANGIRSARAAGLAVVAIPNREFPPGPDALALASRTIDSLDELDTPMMLDFIADAARR